jgi:hypothetical protein
MPKYLPKTFPSPEAVDINYITEGNATNPDTTSPKQGEILSKHSRAERIVMHWTAGGPTGNSIDAEHYHFIVNQDGSVLTCKHPISKNFNVSGPTTSYAAHTKGTNIRAIGVSCAGMMNAVKGGPSSFRAGKYPLTQVQISALVRLVARLARAHGIPISRTTVLSHAEVQETLGHPQDDKWDYTWLPVDPYRAHANFNAVKVGDYLRLRIVAALGVKQSVVHKSDMSVIKPPLKVATLGNFTEMKDITDEASRPRASPTKQNIPPSPVSTAGPNPAGPKGPAKYEPDTTLVVSTTKKVPTSMLTNLKDSFLKQAIVKVARHLVTGAGLLLAGNGVIDPAQANAFNEIAMGVVIYVIGQGWSLADIKSDTK